MGWFRAAAAGLKTYALQSLARREAFVRFQRPVVTITFDDVPRSALINGLPVLDRYAVKATFYVSMGLVRDAPGTFLTDEDVRLLVSEAHEIGCHTWSHYKLSGGSATGLAEDAALNRRRLLDCTDGRFPRNFSFPFGEVTFEAKRALEDRYASMRSTRAGVNAARVDLNCLRAISICRGHWDDALVQRALDAACASGGWLIFYTHGVSDRFDCDSTVERLDSLLARCSGAGVEFRTVDGVVGGLSVKTR